MPDWSYRTFLGSSLAALGPARAQRVSLGALRVLGASAFGRALIDLLGHMRPDARLARAVQGATLAGPVGLGALVDPEGRALSALSRFGAAFVELGPAALSAGEEPRWQRGGDLRLLRAGDTRIAAAALARTLAESPPSAAPIWLRVAHSERDPARLIQLLRAHAAAVLLEVAAETSLDELAQRVRSALSAARDDGQERLLLLSLCADDPRSSALTEAALAAGAQGAWLRGELASDAGALFGRETLAAVEARVQELRVACPDALIVAGGVHQPDDARRLLAAGAQLAAVDSGLVLSGPGLIKRCNEALLAAAPEPREPEALSLDAARSAWFWAFVLGLSMFFGGALALVIASTRVVLPYDEALCGMTRGQLMQLNPRLLPFMAHDRVTLAGSMLSIGVLYTALGYQALRRGAHWAHVTVVCSALCGFFSIFLFLGFGYFDPFHAFVTAILFQFLLMCVAGKREHARPLELPDWFETPAFRRAQWGQLVFVLLAVGLIGAGAVICFLGCSSVFVDTDLEFMRTTAARLAIAHERLVPLVAHDRASLGGMLLANGVALGGVALWGLRAGAAWLWWSLLWAGNLAFLAAVGVHFVVGYTSAFHLAPAFLGWALWWLALGLCRGWLFARDANSAPAAANA